MWSGLDWYMDVYGLVVDLFDNIDAHNLVHGYG